jgi:diguanylate cyclase (GGDEF)-like protein
MANRPRDEPGPGPEEDGDEIDTARTPLVQLAKSVQRPCLVVVAGAQLGQVVRLEREVLIGSGEDAHLRITDDDLVAPLHLKAEPGKSGVHIVDLGTKHGTFIEGERVREKVIGEGVKVYFGRTVLRVSYYDSVEEEAQRGLFEGALRDNLTRSFNHRYFMERLNAEARYAVRHKQALALIYIDVDGLSDLREKHPTDLDEALTRLVELLSNSLRTEDVLARCRGAEFSILACGMTFDHARALADRLCKTVGETPLPCRSGPVSLTISVGIAFFDGVSNEGTAQLFERAQRSSGQARAAGGNRVQG